MRQLCATFVLVISILVLQHPVHASHITFEYFDLKSCTYESITNLIPDPVDSDADSSIRRQAHGRGILEIGSIPRCYGFCDYISGKRISCSLDSCEKFPLRGATFKLIQDKSPLPSYLCVNGCGKGVPRLLHDIGYEPTEDEYNALWIEIYPKFQKACKQKR